MPYDIKKLNSKLPHSKYEQLIDDDQDKLKTMIKSSHSGHIKYSNDNNLIG